MVSAGISLKHWMADVDRFTPRSWKYFSSNGSTQQSGVDDLCDLPDAPWPGRPDLRGDVVADGETFLFRHGGDAEVDGGGIDGDDEQSGLSAGVRRGLP